MESDRLMANDKKSNSIRLKMVPIELDKNRNLKYDMNAFSYLEDVFGGIEEALVALQSGKVKAVLEVLKAGLLHEDPEVTLQQIGSGFGIGEMHTVADKINDALGMSLPEIEEGKGKNV